MRTATRSPLGRSLAVRSRRPWASLSLRRDSARSPGTSRRQFSFAESMINALSWVRSRSTPGWATQRADCGRWNSGQAGSTAARTFCTHGRHQARALTATAVLSVEEEAAVIAFRKHTMLPVDDCLYALQPTIAHLTRSSPHRCLQRHGVSRSPQMDGDKEPRTGI